MVSETTKEFDELRAKVQAEMKQKKHIKRLRMMTLFADDAGISYAIYADGKEPIAMLSSWADGRVTIVSDMNGPTGELLREYLEKSKQGDDE